MTSINNISSFILDCTKKFETSPAFIVKDISGFRRPLSYKEFNDTVLKISQMLRQRFSKPGFKIGLWGENRIEWAAVALGTWHAGGILVPLMHIATEHEVGAIILRAKLDALFISPKLEKKAPNGVNNVWGLDFKIYGGQENPSTLGDLLHQMPSQNVTYSPSTTAQDLAILIFTSGTTGEPKGVMLSHGNILTNILDTIEVVPVQWKDRLVSVLPLSHMFELLGGFLVVHTKGACISYPDSLKPEDVIKELKDHKATAMAAVPLFFEILDRTINEKIKSQSTIVQNVFGTLKKAVVLYPPLGRVFFKKIHDAFGGSIKYFMSGGAKISPDIIESFRGLGIYVFQGYGLTETSPVISFTSFKNDKHGSVGRPVQSLQVRIDNPTSGEGEIVVKGPSVFTGYFENPAATAEVLKNGWFHTGDIGHLDDEGFLFITGRKKDIIVTPNGKNIYPEEIEFYLKQSPRFQEVCVLGLDKGRGETVHAALVTKLSEKEARAEIEKYTLELSDYKKIQSISLFREELPKTATKKVRKHLLLEMIKNQSAENQDSSDFSNSRTDLSLEDPIQSWTQSLLKEITKQDMFWMEQSLKHELSIDSLTFMEIISTLEKKWGAALSDGDFETIQTVGDLVKLAETGSKVSEPYKKETVPFDFRSNNFFLLNFLRILCNLLVIKPLMKLFFRFQSDGAKDLAMIGNFIVTPNHSSHLDLLAIVASLPLSMVNKTYAVAADDYFFNNPVKAFIVRVLFNAVPFKRRARVEESFKVCEDILMAGGNLVIFPEGTRSPNGKMSSFRPGVGRLLSGKAYLAVPARIKGAYDAFPKGATWPKPSAVKIVFSKPLQFESYLTEDKNSYLTIAKKLESTVSAL